MLIWNLCH